MEMIEAVTLILGVLLALLFIIPRFNKPTGQSKTEALNSNTNNISKESRRYTKAEVSLHDKRTDCWVIIKDKVYDVTSYVEEHPGGDAILTHAGDDSTEGFYGYEPIMSVFYVAVTGMHRSLLDYFSRFCFLWLDISKVAYTPTSLDLIHTKI